MRKNDTRFEPTDDDFIPVSSETIDRLQSDLGPLPRDYVKFITTFGGCGFAGDAAVIRADGKRFPILSFFGSDEDSRDLYEVLESHSDLMADKKLPIADDEMGSIFVLDPRTEQVFHINFAKGVADAHLLADSFSHFLSLLQVLPEDEE